MLGETSDSILDLLSINARTIDGDTIDQVTLVTGDIARLLADETQDSVGFMEVYTTLQAVQRQFRGTDSGEALIADGKIETHSYLFGVTSTLDAVMFAFAARKEAQAERAEVQPFDMELLPGLREKLVEAAEIKNETTTDDIA